MGFHVEHVARAADLQELPRKSVKFDLAQEGEGAVWEHVHEVSARGLLHIDSGAMETHRAFVAALLEERSCLGVDASIPENAPLFALETSQTDASFTSMVPEGTGAVWEHVVNVAARAHNDEGVEAIKAHKAFIASLLDKPLRQDATSAVPDGAGAVWEHLVDVSARAARHVDMETMEMHRAVVASLLDCTEDKMMNVEDAKLPCGEGAVWEHLVQVSSLAPTCMDAATVETHKAFVAAMLDGALVPGLEAQRSEILPSLVTGAGPKQADKHSECEVCTVPEGEGAVWEHMVNAVARASACTDTAAVIEHKAFIDALLAEQPVVETAVTSSESFLLPAEEVMTCETPAVLEGEGAVWEHVGDFAARARFHMNEESLEAHKAFIAAMLEGTPCQDVEASVENSSLPTAVLETIPQSTAVEDLWVIKSKRLHTCADWQRQISDASTAATDFLRKSSCGSAVEWN